MVPRNGFSKALKKLYDYLDTISVNNYSTLPVGTVHVVSSNQQMISYESLTVDGQLQVEGELRVVSWPS